METESGERKTKEKFTKEFLEKKENLTQAVEHETVAIDFLEKMDGKFLVSDDTNKQRLVPTLGCARGSATATLLIDPLLVLWRTLIHTNGISGNLLLVSEKWFQWSVGF